jgi:hypothetical protein
MAPNRTKTNSPAKVTAGARFETRVGKRTEKKGVSVNPAFFILLFEMLAQLFDKCQELDPAKLTRRMAHPGPWARANMVIDTYNDGEGDITKRQARAMVAAVIAEAKANPKDTAAMVAEGRAARVGATK